MAVIKVACSKCGQRVSGDETFYGTSVQCPICSSEIRFPSGPEDKSVESTNGLPRAFGDEPEQSMPQEAQKPAGQTVPPPPSQENLPTAAPTPTGEPLPAANPQQSIPAPAPTPAPVSSVPDSAGPLPAIVMTLGIIGVACSPLALLCGPAAIIMGHLTMMKVNQLPGKKGQGMTLAGLIMGYVSLVILVVVAVLWVKVFQPMLMPVEA